MKMISTRRGGFLQRWFTMALVLALIAAVTGWFIARSQGFRDMAARQLSERLGLPVAITQSYIGWPYVLVLRGVEAETSDEALDLQIRALRLGRGLQHWTLDVRGARVVVNPTLLENESHRLAATLVRLAHVREAGALDIMRATEHLQPHWRIACRDVDVYWLDHDGQVDGVVRQLQFHMQPIRLPSGNMIYYRIAYPGLAERAFGDIRDLDWEWLTRGGDDYIELQRSGILPPLHICE